MPRCGRKVSEGKPNHSRRWFVNDDEKLLHLRDDEKRSFVAIADIMGRSVAACEQRFQNLKRAKDRPEDEDFTGCDAGGKVYSARGPAVGGPDHCVSCLSNGKDKLLDLLMQHHGYDKPRNVHVPRGIPRKMIPSNETGVRSSMGDF